jgi:DNA-binding winged helix-turn-helix (wHTH) protein
MLTKPRELYTFGPYSLAMSSRLLARSGEAVTLAPKTFDLLAVLVKSNGRLLSKSELMGSLWPDTFVEEANLSFQISTLRKALGEDGMQWIETVPKHGYRFTAEVESAQAPGEEAKPSASQERVGRWKTRWYLPAAAALALAIILLAVFVKRTALPNSREPEWSSPAVPLTAYPGYEVSPSLSPDGSQVAFSWNGSTGDNYDIYVKLVGPGRALRLTTDSAFEDSPAWSPDGRFIVFQRFNSEVNSDVFVIPALGGAERKVATMTTGVARLKSSSYHFKFPPSLTWTPDGRWIAFGGRPLDNETPGIWLIAADGSEKPRRLTQVTGHEFDDSGPAFSPDGRKLAFIRQRTLSASAVYMLPLASAFTPAGAPERLTRESASIRGLAWTPDSNGLVFSSGGHLGLSRLQKITVPTKRAEPVGPIQPLPFGEHATGISISRSGRLVYSAQFRDTNLWNSHWVGRL